MDRLKPFRQMTIVMRKELKDSLRDRRALFSIAFSIVVGPVLIGFMMNRIADRQRESENVEIPVVGQQHAPAFVDWLRQQAGVNVVAGPHRPEQAVRDRLHDVVDRGAGPTLGHQVGDPLPEPLPPLGPVRVSRRRRRLGQPVEPGHLLGRGVEHVLEEGESRQRSGDGLHEVAPAVLDDVVDEPGHQGARRLLAPDDHRRGEPGVDQPLELPVQRRVHHLGDGVHRRGRRRDADALGRAERAPVLRDAQHVLVAGHDPEAAVLVAPGDRLAPAHLGQRLVQRRRQHRRLVVELAGSDRAHAAPPNSDGGTPMLRGSRYACRPSGPSSRPRPDSLRPPNGTSGNGG